MQAALGWPYNALPSGGQRSAQKETEPGQTVEHRQSGIDTLLEGLLAKRPHPLSPNEDALAASPCYERFE